ncbi:MAG: AMP-binding protein [Micrococcales bacterium]|nr:AMP-binding protein [Micrococcales bacterium]
MALRWSDTRPTLGEQARALAAGLSTVGVVRHPVQVAQTVLAGLPRHGTSIAAALAAGGRVRGGRVALVDGDGAVTYGELDREASRLAAALVHHRLAGPGQRVAVACHDDRHLFVALGAASRAGADVVLVAPGRVVDAGPVDLVLHADDAVLPGTRAEADVAERARTGHVPCRDWARLVAAVPSGVRPPAWARRSTLVLLTSGTTGAPTGVPLRHGRARASAGAALTALALAGATRVRSGEPCLVWPPLHHGYGLAVAVLCLVTGAPMVLATAVDARRDEVGGPGAGAAAGGAALAVVRRYGVRVIVGAPPHLRCLAAHLASDQATSHPGWIGRLRAVVSGSDVLDVATLTTLTDRLGPVVVNCYGSTEAGTFAFADGPRLARAPTTVGRPVVGTRIEVVDGTGRPVPVGTTGRVRVTSPLVSVADEPGGRRLTLPDTGRLDAYGRLYLTGRVGPVVRLGGEHVDPDRVRALLAAQPGVVQAQVDVVPDDIMGQRLTATLTLAPGVVPTPDAWRQAVRDRLGAPAVPRQVVCCAVEGRSCGSGSGSDGPADAAGQAERPTM